MDSAVLIGITPETAISVTEEQAAVAAKSLKRKLTSVEGGFYQCIFSVSASYHPYG